MIISLLLILTTLLTDTTHTEAFVGGGYGASTYALEGKQYGGFTIAARSVYDISAKHRVFGEASYSWNQSKDNRFVENADYELLYPYLTCDTVGGGLKSEHYAFRGGYRMLTEHVLWHLALQFRAEQSYREVDPRPKNKVTDLSLDGSVGYVDGGYAYSLVAGVGRYKQTNEIKFYSELGESMIYHLVQPGADYVRFAGKQKEAYYHGYHVGGSLQVLPKTTGWMASAGYEFTAVTKELHDNTYIPIGRLRTHDISALLGYYTAHWHATLSGGVMLRRGTQYIYGSAENNYYHLLSKRANYAENRFYLSLDGLYVMALPFGQLVWHPTLPGVAGLTAEGGPTASAVTRFSELGDLLTDSHVAARLNIRYQFPLRGKFGWFIEPSADYTHYTKTTRHTWQVALITGLYF